MVKLFVGGFPLEMTELELVKMIGPHGDVETIKIVRDKKTRICKGYAFLEMKDRTGAENAVIALDGTPIADRILSVKINDDFVKKTPPPRKSFGYGNNNSRSGGDRTNNTRSYNGQSNYRSNNNQSPGGDRPRRPRKTM
ncbi:RNA-binding protein [Mucilaginibacter rubeus]|uniref:RNA-binding protein n=1 Tax=Mucilaginibacter rubeus TaxID=2027860 RepID=A0AAE6MHY6_9SPHI|nr:MULTISPECIES: RNA-binding protein [Mucilaginibacter]QEM03993.1 RNA-binding protein [Mucilaginibacter rubeus]QEM16601.1 RNA-binding protein [Mucilaginibacter gossypii]QTE40622.1 RNA-binding protein [Mucilaginibacter rubeus]QTE47224.1 RNA-binding protein [Mucilaginibacter rubeus]QTE58617.1 RNA-binding protein [Mucilaginibacter rubeus]